MLTRRDFLATSLALGAYPLLGRAQTHRRIASSATAWRAAIR